MLNFTNHYYAAIFTIAVVLTVAGFLRFIVQVIRWDSEYEDFLIFPLRLAIYAIPYLFIPVLGLAIGGVMVKSRKRVRRKFAKASMYVSVVGLMLWISSIGMAIR